MRRLGFTLMELLIVLVIILVLLAILFPVLAAARRSAQITHTRTGLEVLRQAAESYYTLFDAYPGPASEGDICTTGALTGAQNLAVGLTRKVRNAATPGYVAAGAGFWVEADYSNGPEKFGRPLTTPLAVPGPGETSAGDRANGALSAAPLFVDKFSSALPILYYRGNVGAKTLVGSSPADGVAAFYLGSNAALTSGPIQAADGTTFKQGLTAAGLGQLVSSPDGTAKGAYVLISAGPDRLYGPDAAGKCDDIVIGGGR